MCSLNEKAVFPDGFLYMVTMDKKSNTADKKRLTGEIIPHIVE